MLGQAIPISGATIRIERDTLFAEVHGAVSAEIGKQFLPALEQLLATYGFYFAIIDIRRMETIDPETRRIFGEWSRKRRPNGAVACFGGSLIQRTLVTLIIHALNMLGTNRLQVNFVKTEQEAHDWIQAQRSNRQQGS